MKKANILNKIVLKLLNNEKINDNELKVIIRHYNSFNKEEKEEVNRLLTINNLNKRFNRIIEKEKANKDLITFEKAKVFYNNFFKEEEEEEKVKNFYYTIVKNEIKVYNMINHKKYDIEFIIGDIETFNKELAKDNNILIRFNYNEYWSNNNRNLIYNTSNVIFSFKNYDSNYYYVIIDKEFLKDIEKGFNCIYLGYKDYYTNKYTYYEETVFNVNKKNRRYHIRSIYNDIAYLKKYGYNNILFKEEYTKEEEKEEEEEKEVYMSSFIKDLINKSNISLKKEEESKKEVFSKYLKNSYNKKLEEKTFINSYDNFNYHNQFKYLGNKKLK